MRAQSDESCAELRRGRLPAAQSPRPAIEEDDPFGPDLPGDAVVVTTERRLRRLVVVACDAGVRAGQGRLDGDAAEWMFARHAIFEGRRAIDGSQDLAAFVCASLVHGLALDFELPPHDVLALGTGLPGPEIGASAARRRSMPAQDPTPTEELFTCTLEGGVDGAGRSLQAFCAFVAASEEEVRARLRQRYGERLSELACVSRGFDAEAMLPRLLLGSALRGMLTVAARDPAGHAARSLDLHLEQRYVA